MVYIRETNILKGIVIIFPCQRAIKIIFIDATQKKENVRILSPARVAREEHVRKIMHFHLCLAMFSKSTKRAARK